MKMKFNLKIFILTLTTLVLFSSCNENNPEPNPTNEELIIDGEWIKKRDEFYENGILVNESTSDTINVVNYKSDNTGTIKHDGQLYVTFTWSLNTTETQLTTIVSGQSFIYDIEKLTNTALWFSETKIENGITKKLVYIFER